ncbi:transglycosylase SLT domain-containing protein [Halothiobacillus sp. DCM-1]|uniref:lytic transglycosylase domain-containing protein n=1 Tax=Halothiobacillus sp. DCM-1 TaxID=3112558 RepID=UPI0032434316
MPANTRIGSRWIGLALSFGLMQGVLAAEAPPAPAWMPPPAFTEGLTALAAADVTTASADVQALGESPLATYLQFRVLMATASSDPAAAVAFIQNNPDFIFSTNLKARTLSVLAAQNRWADYLALTSQAPSLKNPPARQCQYWQAEIETQAFGESDAADALALWQQGRALPKSCDAVVHWLETHDRLDRAAYQARLRGAVMDGNLSFAELVVRQGTRAKIPGLAAYLRRWRDARVDPSGTIATLKTIKKPTAEDQALMTQALIWLARADPQAAAELLPVLSVRQLPAESRDRVAQTLALKAAYTRMPQAYAWLMALPEAVQNHETRTWAVRAALRTEDWRGVRQALYRLSVDTAAQPEWQYWRARADEALGDKSGAEARWQALLIVPDYYGFLAADRLGVPFPWRSLPHPQIATDTVVNNPAVQLAFYLRSAGQIDDARRAYLAAFEALPPAQQPALAQLAIDEQWYDRASIAIARLGKQDDPAWFTWRYPMPWRDAVEAQAKAQGLTPDWLYAVMRRESLFMSDVGSGAGAQGLMQLMPATARWINHKANLGLDAIDLHDPATNITLGAAYLAHLNMLYDGQMPLAVAAYNAGPGRVKQWRPEDRSLPGDVWVDTIVFDETRNYVRAVMGARLIYQWRSSILEAQSKKVDPPPVGEKPPALLAWLTPVTPSGGQPAVDLASTTATTPAGAAAGSAASAATPSLESVAQTRRP